MKMRVYHRYLGFFTAGIMAVYAISGITLIFRDTNTFKVVEEITVELPAQTEPDQLGEALGMRRFRVDSMNENTVFFRDGSFDRHTGIAKYTKAEMPFVLEKMSQMHKATSSKPLAFLNVIFGLSLLFFVVSSFWMFFPGTDIFKKGLLFAGVGIVLALVMIFI